MEEFNVRLKKAMILRDISQTELCSLTDIPKSAISQYLSGNFKPKQTRTYILSEALHVSPAWLMGYDVPVEHSSFDKASDFYRILLSDQGLRVIQKQLSPRITSYGINELALDLGIEIQDIKQFLTSDLTMGHKCLKKLDDMLVILETNIYDLIKKEVLEEKISDNNTKYETPIPLTPRKIAAYGADGTKQTNPPKNPRKIT